MDAVDSTHVLDYYARHYRPGMVDLSTSSPSGAVDLDEQRVGYGPPGGLPALREAIASLYPGLAAEHVVATNGATEALAATAFALVRPGQRVFAGDEIYPSFRETAARLGALLSSENPSLAAVNHPTVPDGRFADLQPLIASLEAAGGLLVADEVYLDLRADAPGVPAASISRSAISIGDLSKPLGLGGLRIGWVACRNERVVEAIGRSVQLLSGGPSVIAMEAGLVAVRDYAPRLAARCAAAAQNAPLVFAALAEAGWHFQKPEAGWTFLARPPERLQRPQFEALAAAGFFLIPGSAFGAPDGFRISLFAPVESLRTALQTLSAAPSGESQRGPARGRGSLVVLAKSAAPGQSKTRLANEVGVREGAELAAAFLRDTIDLALASGHEVTVAFTPFEARAEFASIAPGATLVAQPEGDLGLRLAAALVFGLCGRDSAVLIGSDTPQLPSAVIEKALRALRTADLVVGPATDGGFYLLGIREAKSVDRLFDGIEWSTPAVFGQLMQNAQRLGLTVQVLEAFSDIDDTESLANVLRFAARSGTAPWTRATAGRLGLGPV